MIDVSRQICGPSTSIVTRLCLISMLLSIALGGNVMPPKTIVTWVNGIGFNMDHMVDGERDLSVLFGNRPIIFCHNPTAMADEADMKGYMGDLLQGGAQKLGRITSEVEALVQ